MAQSPAHPEPIAVTQKPSFKVRLPLGWFWPVLWSALMVGSGVLGIWAIAWLTKIPPLPNCEDVSPASSLNNRLICAQANLQTGSVSELTKAVQLTAGWPEGHSLHAEAYPVLLEASQRLLKKATQRMHRGELDTAVQWAGEIPLETPLRQSAQASIWNWQQEWKKGNAIEQTAKQAIDAQDWALADTTLQKLKHLSSDYWLRQRHGELQQIKQREQTAWEQIAQARALAATSDPDNIGQALTLVQRVDLTSQAWSAAQADIDRWSQNLLLYSFQRWELGDVEGAIATVQKVPPDPSLVPEARDLIQFSHAKRLADQAQQQQPNPMQLLYLMEAIRAVEQIDASSPFYQAAQQFLQGWQAQLSDLRIVQLANLVAGFHQPLAYQYASDLAWEVGPDRPRRLQAQTLIAHWEDQIERVEDRPYLQLANALAEEATIPALQAAIAEARKVALGRAMRIEAQTRIADWTNRIEVIQDQPVLNRANTLASEDKLREAIEVAQGITPDRALHNEAQAMIVSWTRTIEVQEDSPIFEEAKSLAYRGSLTRAIDLATQIAPGRALYGEVQTAIALWEAERAYIWEMRAQEARARATEPVAPAPKPTESEEAPTPTPSSVPPNQVRPPTSNRR